MYVLIIYLQQSQKNMQINRHIYTTTISHILCSCIYIKPFHVNYIIYCIIKTHQTTLCRTVNI